MAERMIGLSIDTLFGGDHNHQGITKFVEGFSTALYSGDGKKPAALAALGIDADFPLRLLVGIPKKSLTREWRILAEAYCSLAFGRPLGETSGLWTHRPGWQPINPGRKPAAIDGSILDVDWMLSLGISKSIWETSVLASPAVMTRQTNSRATIRHLLMLSVFGFSDPYQFFTATDDPEKA